MLHIIVALGVGGAERLVVSAVTGLRAPAFEHVICCLTHRGALAAEAEQAGARVESIGAFPGLHHPAAFARMYRLIRTCRPDIVHTHLQAANLYGRFAAWLARVPAIVATEHNVYTSKARRYIAVERLLARRTTAVVAVSEQVRRFLADQLQIDSSMIRVIRNGVSLPHSSPAGVDALRRRLSIPEGRVVLGTVASLTPKKGHKFLFQALTLLRDRGVACSLVVAGNGPERPRLEALAAALALVPHVHFLGEVAHPADVLELADIFVTLLAASTKVKLTAIFAPEHGFSVAAQAGASIPSGKDSSTGVPVYSLHERGVNGPTPEMLKNVDVLVFDLQEVGARFWTYTTSLGYMLEAAAARKIPLFVLDRPNPINGIAVEGALLDSKYFSNIGYGRRPIRHGMTSGELAGLFNGENKIGQSYTSSRWKAGSGACGWTRPDWSGVRLHRISAISPQPLCIPAPACSKTRPSRWGGARTHPL